MLISRKTSTAPSLSRAFAAVIAASVLSLSLVGCSMLNAAQDASTGGPSSTTEGAPSKPDSGDASGDSAANTKALEAYAAAERVQLPAILEQNKAVYSDASVETKAPGTIIFTYVYVAKVDPAAGTAYFDGKISDFQKICDDQVFPAMEKAGVKGPKHVQYVYKNPDGSTIWEKDFAS